MKGERTYILDSEHNIFTTNDLMLIFNISRAHINYMIRKHNPTSIKKFSKIVVTTSVPIRWALRIPDENGDEYTITQISKMLKASRSWVRMAYTKHKCSTVEEIIHLRKFPLVRKKQYVQDSLKFDRGAFCYRNDFLETCEYYKSCSDARCFTKKHHERYKADGSCYTRESKKWVRQSFKENVLPQFFS